MDKILGGLVKINGADIWTEYGVFLTEKKKGGRDNLKAITRASKVKAHVGVNIREENGVKYSKKLTVVNEEREVSLYFALVADNRELWWTNYTSFIRFLKQGTDGWLNVTFTELGLTLRMFYVDSTDPEPLTCLWKGGRQASRFKIKFKEPNPIF